MIVGSYSCDPESSQRHRIGVLHVKLIRCCSLTRWRVGILLFSQSRSFDNAKRYIGHQIEQENAQLIKGDTGEVDRVELLRC